MSEQRGSSSRVPDFVAALASSFRSQGPIAEEVIARDVAECTSSDDDDESPADTAVESSSESGDDEAGGVAYRSINIPGGPGGPGARGKSPGPTLYRRPSGVAYGTARPIMNPAAAEGSRRGGAAALTRIEKLQSRDAERSLLRDNHVLPPKHAGGGRGRRMLRRAFRAVFSTKVPKGRDEETGPATAAAAAASAGSARRASEATPLLGGGGPPPPLHEHLTEAWDAAVAAGKVKTTWQRETKTIVGYAAPLIVTFLLQYSINVTSIFAVGRIGKEELGAVSLASMTAIITGYAPLQGLATSLDTLCAQAYGSGHKHLVGLQLQRMTFFLLLCFVPMAVLWWFGHAILAAIIPEARSAELAGQYLRVLILGGPGFVFFETGKRFVQAQGLFQATTYVLLIAAPLNIFINWLLVWHFRWGFIGAPVAVVFTETLMPVLLLLYVLLINGRQCWGGFSWRAWSNWGVMVRLALPGMIMVEAEYLAFEILTLFSSRFGTEYLAAQSVLLTLASTGYQIPFPLSIAASTRIANLIGAGLVDAAKTTARVAFFGAAIVGIANLVIFSAFRYQLPTLFTKDPEVIAIVAHTLPVVAVMQVFDGLCVGAHGLLRGIGRQEIGGYVNLAVYYLLAVPLSFGTGFGLDWKLNGLWFGVTIGLIVVAVFEYWFAYVTDWDKAAKDAESRNEAG